MTSTPNLFSADYSQDNALFSSLQMSFQNKNRNDNRPGTNFVNMSALYIETVTTNTRWTMILQEVKMELDWNIVVSHYSHFPSLSDQEIQIFSNKARHRTVCIPFALESDYKAAITFPALMGSSITHKSLNYTFLLVKDPAMAQKLLQLTWNFKNKPKS